MFTFDKLKLQDEILKFANLESIKKLKKRSNTNSKVGANLLNIGFTMTTGIPADISSPQNKNLFRFTNKIDREVIILIDLLSSEDLLYRTSRNIKNIQALEVFNEGTKGLQMIK